ncbi:MAG: SGNH/GDSL hydrolase family protein [Lewinellaceae bacterium]|nr:SGNH/GDSL hydrolase family protein [Lewinellaceae bacterium]
MQYINVLATCFLFLIARSGHAQQAAVQRLTKPLRIVVIGSSTAAGVGARPLDSAWVNRYQAHLKTLHPACQVVNLGKSGYQTFHLLPTGHKPLPFYPAPDTLRNITKALSLRPDAVIINLPSNDAAAGYDAQVQLDNFEIIAFAAWAADVPLWITTVQPRNFDTTKIQTQFQVLQAMAKRYGDQVINFWEGLAGPDGTVNSRYNSGDGIHLNNAGHALLFERMAAKNIPAHLALHTRNLYTMDDRWAGVLPLSNNDFRHPALTPKPLPAVLLQAAQPMDEVIVEVFDANDHLLRKLTTNLPHLLPGDFGPKGVYRIQLRKGAWAKTVRWTKI